MIDPIVEHQRLIERFASGSPSLGAQLIRSEGQYSKSKDAAQLNRVITRLSAADREAIAQMLERERCTALFDSLGILHEVLSAEGFTLSKAGVPIPHEPFGYTMFEEYVTLLDDDRGWAALR